VFVSGDQSFRMFNVYLIGGLAQMLRWMDGWLGFNGILSMQVSAISCLRKFKVC